MSVWKKDSDVLRLNAAAGDRPVPVSKETIEALVTARQVSEWTDGKFDVTFGALTDIWKFDHDQDNSIPAGSDRRPPAAHRLSQTEVDDRAGTVFLKRKGMNDAPGRHRQGYAVDRAVALPEGSGLARLLNPGRRRPLRGRPQGDRPWRLGIADPRGPDGTFSRVDLTDSTFSTSGDYERSFMKDGVRYHHILDPATGQPARLCRSVTIVAKQAVLADGLSTGVFVLGPDKGMALIERLPDVEGVIVGADNQVHVSSGLQGKVEIVHPPTEGP